MSRNVCPGVFAVCLLALLGGCAPAASPQTYSLVAQVVPVSSQGNIIAAVIDVVGESCTVRVVTLESARAWVPVCLITKDQRSYKSFIIGGHAVNMGEVSGSFEVLSSPLPSIPVTAATHRGTVTAVAATGSPAFPDTWNMEPYPGHLKLRGQDAGFMIINALLTINGSEGVLEITYKSTYTPLHLTCTVTTDQNGDFKLSFDPTALVQIAGRGTYTVNLVSEGQSITGSIWDSSEFATWHPALPPRWVRVSG